MKLPRKKIFKQFMAGDGMIKLSQRHGIKKLVIEEIIRKSLRRNL